MTESADAPSDPPAAGEVVARAGGDGVAVRKVATLHGSEAVAVYFSVRSMREDRCTIRIADALPEPLRDHEVEFHPKYDPVNWSRSEGSVVYAAEVPPDANRTTVYGVVVDDPGQLELFSAEPAVEVTDSQPAGSADPADRSFDFQTSSDSADPTPPVSTESTPDRSATAVDTGPESDQVSGTERTAVGRGSPDEDVVDRLVSAVRRRDLTRAERRSIRRALGVEGAERLGTELDALHEAVAALRDEVAAADRQAADVDRLEAQIDALADSLEDRYASLAADIEDLADALDREARWRSQLSESLSREPE